MVISKAMGTESSTDAAHTGSLLAHLGSIVSSTGHLCSVPASACATLITKSTTYGVNPTTAVLVSSLPSSLMEIKLEFSGSAEGVIRSMT